MISIRPSIKDGVLGLVILASTPFLFGANNPVEVESLSENTETATYEPPIEEERDGSTPEGFETQYRLQVLQQEVQELRGQVEELTYQLNRMRGTAEDRYLELDSRFQDLQAQIESGARPGSVDPSLAAEIRDASKSGDSETPTDSGQSEKALYETALELIRNRQFDVAITQLQAVISQYPDGQFVANAYYWLGEVHAAKPEPDYEAARQALAQVISFFPDHRKVPDAAFKLGKVYHLMGDCGRAGELLNQVVKDHPGKSAAKLSQNYLEENMGNCDM